MEELSDVINHLVPTAGSEEEIYQAAAKVMPSKIGHTLAELEMIKEIPVSDDKVILTMALPFLGVPIRDHLLHSVQEAVMKPGAEIEVQLKEKCL